MTATSKKIQEAGYDIYKNNNSDVIFTYYNQLTARQKNKMSINEFKIYVDAKVQMYKTLLAE
jgi:hypothetical protein